MRENAGAAERLLQRISELSARVRAFDLSLHAERVELCAQLHKHRRDIPDYDKWCGHHRPTPKS
jgi:hypothetical protein